MTEARRVAVTGMGAVSAAGFGAKALWEAARDGRSCVRKPRFARPYRGRIKIAAQVPEFDPAEYLSAEELPFCDPVTQYVLIAAEEAIRQAGLREAMPMGPRTATIIGTGIGGMSSFENGLYRELVEHARPDPLIIPRLIPSACPSQLSIRYGSRGPCFAVASACSSAAQAIGIGAHLIRSGAADRALAGGTEDCITTSGMLGWEVLRVLTPDACRPFSR
ncbi:MAG TPA: beta-ketoacyl synthase N-terminal-like domain-containing protein, partial [Methylocella sp.]|nr:beta-ketoacyl synthase N-terminal-like domain-containing protein [Methylocella sp.]